MDRHRSNRQTDRQTDSRLVSVWVSTVTTKIQNSRSHKPYLLTSNITIGKLSNSAQPQAKYLVDRREKRNREFGLLKRTHSYP